MLKTCRILILALFLSIMAGACNSMSNNMKNQVLVDSLNSLCPLEIIKDEVSLTQISYSDGEYFICLTLHDNGPTSLAALDSLHDEYSRRIELEGYDVKEIGTMPFIRGVVGQSSTIRDFINAIESTVYTQESTQGYLPIKFILKDAVAQLQDTITYSDQWEDIELNEWLNAIMPIEMCKWTMTRENILPPLNEMVRIEGIPSIGKNGFLTIHCSYDASPAYTNSGKPICIDDIKGQYFSKKILEDYLADRMAENKEVYRFLSACSRRGIGIQFIVDGFKDAIDYDSSTPEFIKQWEGWGGKDSIVIFAP